eukprot:gnl/Spiro4/9933_TR5268_c0_g1_i1.p1 gnl/Spiro4/9933_TR5268_c0_g1~~gnl/Spiro4/9933_TR5268_c0_g1_i1.p1  ORF type:complete len:322 (-),score=60.85 gnl/Spiro4/9933_TR5268_c0_g1_i1:135-1100(-)
MGDELCENWVVEDVVVAPSSQADNDCAGDRKRPRQKKDSTESKRPRAVAPAATGHYYLVEFLRTSAEGGLQPRDGSSSTVASSSKRERTNTAESKSAKRRRKLRDKHMARKSHTFETAMQSSEAQAEFLTSLFAEEETRAQASALERTPPVSAEEVYLPQEAESASLLQLVTHALPPLDELLRDTTPQNGAPFVIVVCSTTRRAIELSREMKAFRTETIKIARLFAKHVNATTQGTALSQNQFSAAVGTPNRLLKLALDSSLSCANVRLVVVDAAPDKKGVSLLASHAPSRADAFRLITHVRSAAVPRPRICLYNVPKAPS